MRYYFLIFDTYGDKNSFWNTRYLDQVSNLIQTLSYPLFHPFFNSLLLTIIKSWKHFYFQLLKIFLLSFSVIKSQPCYNLYFFNFNPKIATNGDVYFYEDYEGVATANEDGAVRSSAIEAPCGRRSLQFHDESRMIVYQGGSTHNRTGSKMSSNYDLQIYQWVCILCIYIYILYFNFYF